MSDIYTVREAAAEGKAGGWGSRHPQVKVIFRGVGNGCPSTPLPQIRKKNPEVPRTCLLWEVTGERNSGLATLAAAYLPTICFLADKQTRRIMR